MAAPGAARNALTIAGRGTLRVGSLGSARDADVAAHARRRDFDERPLLLVDGLADGELGFGVAADRADVEPRARAAADADEDVAGCRLQLHAARGHGTEPLVARRRHERNSS